MIYIVKNEYKNAGIIIPTEDYKTNIEAYYSIKNAISILIPMINHSYL